MQQKGKALIIDGQRYSYDDIGDLPHNLSLENAKIVQATDSVVFQGKHAYLSNLAYSPFVDNGEDFRCSEQYIHIGRTKLAGDKRNKENLRGAKSLYDMLRNGKRIKLPEGSEAQEHKLVVKAVVLKFKQNPLLLDKLKKITGHIYEATLSKKWGCGFTIAQASRIKFCENPGENRFGLLPEKICDTALAGNDIKECLNDPEL